MNFIEFLRIIFTNLPQSRLNDVVSQIPISSSNWSGTIFQFTYSCVKSIIYFISLVYLNLKWRFVILKVDKSLIHFVKMKLTLIKE